MMLDAWTRRVALDVLPLWRPPAAVRRWLETGEGDPPTAELESVSGDSWSALAAYEATALACRMHAHPELARELAAIVAARAAAAWLAMGTLDKAAEYAAWRDSC